MDSVSVNFKNEFAATVVVASKGYPGAYKKGDNIKIDTLPKTSFLYHAGTESKNGNIITSGGRVLAITGMSETLDGALKCAYEGVSKISFEGMQYRKDIGYRFLNIPANIIYSKGVKLSVKKT